MVTTQSPAATPRRLPALMTAVRKNGRRAIDAMVEVPKVLNSTDPTAQPKVAKLLKSPEQKVRESRIKNNASGQSLPDARQIQAAPPVEQLPVPEDAATAYSGPMLALRERSKLGLYTIAPNGQPSCGDEVAQLLGTLRPEYVIRACVIAMALPFNPYDHLNVGQQSMNLRNRLRTAIKRGDFGMGVIIEAVEEAQAEQDAATH